MWLNRGRFAALFAAAFLGLSALSSGAVHARAAIQGGWQECALDMVGFRQDGGGVVSFTVEIADDHESRARGLMFRRSLPQGHGMLFIYDGPRQLSFWMRNTLIPLDIIFIDPAGVIRHIHPMARPLDETSIPGSRPGDPHPERLMALEIGGGEAARLGLRAGQAMAHPRLPQAQAAFPCA